ncbi:hypothetical protein [Niveispirillum sp.]|uniref:hypothetical protein n=1 Tax=Niveispirillum sp. TaxID=1917217 RepID=UPI001B44813C|nr:hypothetical protein [Niveispirillum sp.]MBP7334504.1 hypothetical protein [Niveispirillum sp.]
MTNIVLRLVGIALGFLGLFLAAGAKDPGMFLGGMLFCLFGVALNFWLIAQDYPHHHQSA